MGQGEPAVTYAVQVRWPDGHWTYVMKACSVTGLETFTCTDRARAEQVAEGWRLPDHPDAVRVVEL